MRDHTINLELRHKPNGVGLSVLRNGESIVNVFETKALYEKEKKRSVNVAIEW